MWVPAVKGPLDTEASSNASDLEVSRCASAGRSEERLDNEASRKRPYGEPPAPTLISYVTRLSDRQNTSSHSISMTYQIRSISNRI